MWSGLSAAGKYVAVVAARVVVVDAQVAIGEHALRDDEVVRLVAAGVHRARRQPICGRAKDQRRHDEDPRRASRRVARSRARGGRPAARAHTETTTTTVHSHNPSGPANADTSGTRSPSHGR